MKTLGREALRYKRMQALQGKAIPLTHGWHKIQSKRKHPDVGLLVLEQWGEPVNDFLERFPRQQQAIILDKLTSVHRAGLVPLDFRELNVLHRDGDFRLIDFENVEVPHKCESPDYDFLTAGEESPSGPDALCYMLDDAATFMDFWREGYAWINGLVFGKSQNVPMDETILKALWPAEDLEKIRRKEDFIEFPIMLHYYQDVKRRMDEGATVAMLKDQQSAMMQIAWEKHLQDHAVHKARMAGIENGVVITAEQQERIRQQVEETQAENRCKRKDSVTEDRREDRKYLGVQ